MEVATSARLAYNSYIVNKHKPETEVVLVGGMGTRMRGSRLEQLRIAGGYTFRCVEGVRPTGDNELEVAPPSWQYKEIRTICDGSERQRLLVSHCSGALAVVQALKEAPPNVSGLLIAPPLRNPYEVLTSSFVRKTIKTIDGVQYAHVDNLLPVADEPPTRAAFPSRYYEEVREASASFPDSVKELTKKGVLKLVVPNQDWNKSALEETSSGWPGPESILRLNARHDLSVLKKPDMQLQNYLSALRFVEGM